LLVSFGVAEKRYNHFYLEILHMKKQLLGLALLATVACGAASVRAEDAAAPAKEKCYGVAKAGKNDCAAKDKSNSCAGGSKVDGDKNTFVSLPAGVCDKLVGGELDTTAAK
jgi:uncharacterized membrane protein